MDYAETETFDEFLNLMLEIIAMRMSHGLEVLQEYLNVVPIFS